MNVENVNIYDLVPSQIAELIDKLKEALSIVKTRKQTLSKVASYERENVKCIECGSDHVWKNGLSKNKIQTYKCKNCNKRFDDLTNTIFSGTHLTYEQIEIFLQCFKDKVSIRKTASRMKVNKKTVHLLRLKMMDSLKEIRENIQLQGQVESDEIYKSINLKGTKPSNMPRASKPRKSKGTTTRGISSHKVCITSAIDENDNMFLEIAGTGPVTSNMVKQSLSPKMGDVTTLITDCKRSYESEANDNGWNLIQIKSSGYTDGTGNSLSNINSLHSGLSTFLSCFKGVSTKHLQGYLDWYIFDKYLNYCFEDDKQYNEILKNGVIRTTIIKERNAYENYSGIDFFNTMLTTILFHRFNSSRQKWDRAIIYIKN